MTIKEAILEKLDDGEATMDKIDCYIVFDSGVGASTRPSVRARVYELMKAGKVVRVRRGIYALPSKSKRKKLQAQTAA